MPSKKQQLGAEVEAQVEAYLVTQGYRIIERNLRIAGSEIDRIAWDGETLCFVEVRFRRNAQFGKPEESVGYGKRKCLIRGAMAYLQRFPFPPFCRFDVVAVLGRGKEGHIRVFQNAFDAAGRSV